MYQVCDSQTSLISMLFDTKNASLVLGVCLARTCQRKGRGAEAGTRAGRTTGRHRSAIHSTSLDTLASAQRQDHFKIPNEHRFISAVSTPWLNAFVVGTATDAPRSISQNRLIARRANEFAQSCFA
jgi:hypothetical protein